MDLTIQIVAAIIYTGTCAVLDKVFGFKEPAFFYTFGFIGGVIISSCLF